MLDNHNDVTKLFLNPEDAKIHVRVEVKYMEHQSRPDHYVFSYRVMLENTGKISAQLIARHWFVTNAAQECLEVRGLGIVGDQPLLSPGEKHEYSSHTVITTPIGTMRGYYLCITENAELFNVNIPEFTLSIPHALH